MSSHLLSMVPHIRCAVDVLSFPMFFDTDMTAALFLFVISSEDLAYPHPANLLFVLGDSSGSHEFRSIANGGHWRWQTIIHPLGCYSSISMAAIMLGNLFPDFDLSRSLSHVLVPTPRYLLIHHGCPH